MPRPAKTYGAPPSTPTPPVAPINEAGESCATCRGAVQVGDRLECHGGPPSAVYRGMVMGAGTYAEPMWPTVKPHLWCLRHEPKVPSA